jgi:hypothetical protein
MHSIVANQRSSILRCRKNGVHKTSHFPATGEMKVKLIWVSIDENAFGL